MRGRRLRIVFFVQSEGRGHMTQALALKSILEDAGHEVVAAFMGEKPDHPVPDFFEEGFSAPIYKYLSPTFVIDRSEKGIRPWGSLFQALENWIKQDRAGRLRYQQKFHSHLDVDICLS